MLLVLGCALPAPASDHADPQNIINPFAMPKQTEANITDLHAFVVDKQGRPVTSPNAIASGDQLIISLCVRPRTTEQKKDKPIRATDSTTFDFDDYTFRVHLDMHPPVRTRLHQIQAEEEKRAASNVTNLTNELALIPPPEKTPPDGESHPYRVKERELKTAAERLARARAALNDERASLFRHGGIIDRPADIAEEAALEFTLKYEKGRGPFGEDFVRLATYKMTGGWTGPREMNVVPAMADLLPGKVNVQAGIYDDPFIFPRFFRRNVVGIVTSIPLDRIPPLSSTASLQEEHPLILWATTHGKDGMQIDHVGRSLRTQLP